MAFRVALRNKAKRAIDRLEARTRSRLYAGIDALKQDPTAPRPGADIKVLEGQHGLRRLRVGDHRVFYYVDVGDGFVYTTDIKRRCSGTYD
ncbi:MAG: type II toxin-antitoxin system RelE family toxin [Methanobacteriota archaeon]